MEYHSKENFGILVAEDGIEMDAMDSMHRFIFFTDLRIHIFTGQ